MTYLQQSLGLDVEELIKRGSGAVAAAGKIVQDPALPEVTCQVLRLNKITEGKDPGAPCVHKRYSERERKKGVGLALATGPLRVVTWARANPILAFGAGVGTAALLMSIGYYIGRRRK